MKVKITCYLKSGAVITEYHNPKPGSTLVDLRKDRVAVLSSVARSMQHDRMFSRTTFKMEGAVLRMEDLSAVTFDIAEAEDESKA